MDRDMIRLEDIPVSIDAAALGRQLRVGADTDFARRLDELVAQARAIARPKALCRQAYIESRGDDHVMVEGVRFTSRVLRVNLASAHRIFPFVVTSGKELDQWAEPMKDLLDRFWAETIKEMAMRAALGALKKQIRRQYHPGKMTTMTPGSITDWPVQEQAGLLSLLGGDLKQIGVTVTSALMMVPTHSLSGIRFPAEESFESCQLCPRQDCPGRRAPYDADLYERRYLERTDSSGPS